MIWRWRGRVPDKDRQRDRVQGGLDEGLRPRERKVGWREEELRGRKGLKARDAGSAEGEQPDGDT